jgi:hypothetical protein
VLAVSYIVVLSWGSEMPVAPSDGSDHPSPTSGRRSWCSARVVVGTFRFKSDVRNHQAIVQPRLYDCLMVTQITLKLQKAIFGTRRPNHGDMSVLSSSPKKAAATGRTVTALDRRWRRARRSPHGQRRQAKVMSRSPARLDRDCHGHGSVRRGRVAVGCGPAGLSMDISHGPS